MISSSVKIDNVDRNIIKLIQKNPNMTHTEISKNVNRSQPTVGMRIRRLEEIGLLQYQAGINIRKANMFIAKVDIQTNQPEKVLQFVKRCPHYLNAFRISGTTNLSVLLVNSRLENLYNIVNKHFRENPHIITVDMDIITDVVNDFVLPLDFSCKNEDCCLNGKCGIDS